MTILVCGGRDYTDYAEVCKVLDQLHQKGITSIVHGAAPGADSLAGRWAWDRKVICSPYPADWKRHGRAAGPIRNRQMLEESKPDFVVAFPGGLGTANMVSISKAAGITVLEVT
jgi:predicted Rossmann-fold nucleotide-binding protein